MSEPSDPTEVVVEQPPADPEQLAEELLHRLNFAEDNLQVPQTLPTPAEPDITDLVPTSGNHPAETLLYRTVVLTDIPDHGQPVTFRPLNEPVKIDDTELESYTRPGEGVIITSQQNWVARGVTLGRLLHSLALAPGESTRIAVVDWTRRDAGSSADTAAQGEQMSSTTDENRDIAEKASGSAKQTDEGSSTTKSKSHSRSGGVSGGFAGLLGGLGGSASWSDNATEASTVARSASAKEATLSTLQNLTARTRQEASAHRTRQATVIKETSQAEGAQVSTRVVTNYNHMHAMSVQYYEVVQSYDVRTFPLRIDRCVFVPMALITFTPELVRRFRSVLAAAAPLEWADRIAGSVVTRTGAATNVTADGYVIDSPVGSPTLSQIAAASDGTVCGVTLDGKAVRWDPHEQSWVPLPAVPNNAAVVSIAVGRATEIWVVGQDNTVYRLRDGVFVADPLNTKMNVIACCEDGSLFGVTHETGNSITLRRDANNWSQIPGGGGAHYITAASRTKIWYIELTPERVYPGEPGGNRWHNSTNNDKPMKMIAAASDASLWGITTNNELYVHDVLDTDDKPFRKPAFVEDPRVAKLAWVAPVSRDEVWGITTDGRPVRIRRPSSAVDDAVLHHLNGDRNYYSQVVWANLDEITLSRILASYTYTPSEPAPDGDTGDTPTPVNRPLGACLDPTPVAVTGNYLAFRWNYPTESARLAWLRRSQLHEGDGLDSQHAVVAVPSAGVFAEAVLARANAAEKIDLTRFWNWKDSPIPILPPEISPVGLDSRARDLDLTSHGLDPALAQLQQLRALPDPTGMAAITKTMTTKLFEDMSKASETANVALQGLKEAAAAEQAAGSRSVEVYKAALEHYQKTLEAAEKLLPMIAPELGAAGALSGAAGSGARSPLTAAGPATESTGLRGMNLSGTGGLFNLAGGNGKRGTDDAGGAQRPGGQTSGQGAPLDALAANIVRDIGIPSLKAAVREDPSLAALPPEQLSELVGKSIIDALRDPSRRDKDR